MGWVPQTGPPGPDASGSAPRRAGSSRMGRTSSASSPALLEEVGAGYLGGRRAGSSSRATSARRSAGCSRPCDPPPPRPRMDGAGRPPSRPRRRLPLLPWGGGRSTYSAVLLQVVQRQVARRLVRRLGGHVLRAASRRPPSPSAGAVRTPGAARRERRRPSTVGELAGASSSSPSTSGGVANPLPTSPWWVARGPATHWRRPRRRPEAGPRRQPRADRRRPVRARRWRLHDSGTDSRRSMTTSSSRSPGVTLSSRASGRDALAPPAQSTSSMGRSTYEILEEIFPSRSRSSGVIWASRFFSLWASAWSTPVTIGPSGAAVPSRTAGHLPKSRVHAQAAPARPSRDGRS